MTGEITKEYKRPTKTIDLPSGKKVEVVEYFTNYENSEIQKATMKNVKFKASDAMKVHNKEIDQAELMKNVEISMDDMIAGNAKRFEFAIKKLIDEDGTEYEPTIENVRNFIDEYDAQALVEAFDAKKK